MTDEPNETHTLRRPIRAPFVWAPTDEQSKVLDRLIDIEPELSKMVRGKQAWQVVGETAKKVALWLTAMAGAFYVLREIIRSMAA
ncbi:hypothetical protein LA66_07110 [Aureimonas altamirensis]|uniref:Uncharacterized protein n=1 Tax=Aureimonas altamirensis TaxID=370622 RepID=A0A0B1QBW3_9HYPH|nr:hypothetical protein [Aureimonas altamirensis]KHJ56315.1 hypothetical protein LA66_07110 [Aureimonas altamirensis]